MRYVLAWVKWLLVILALLCLCMCAAQAQSIFSNGFESAGGGAPVCPEPPAGWQARNLTWESAWRSRAPGSPIPVYPNSGGSPVPIGAAKGGYTVIPFVPGVNEIVSIYWEPVQSGPGYRQPRPAEGMWMSISPCPGDFRPQRAFGDPFLRAGCRKGAATASLIYGTSSFETNDQACHLEAGVTYYLNVIAANPDDGLDDGEHSCANVPNSAQGCDVQAISRGLQ